MNIAEFEALTEEEKAAILGKISDRATCEVCHGQYHKQYINRTSDNKEFCICDDCAFGRAAGPFSSDIVKKVRTFFTSSDELKKAKVAMSCAAYIINTPSDVDLEHPVRRAMFRMFFDGMGK